MARALFRSAIELLLGGESFLCWKCFTLRCDGFCPAILIMTEDPQCR